MEVVVTNVALAVGLAVACINLITAVISYRKQKKRDRRSAKRRSE
ncbi:MULTISPECIES: hypothetical protein [Gracilibacillus]|nr:MULTISPECIES: hypothetical protein [Gracilibacillus]